MPPCILTIGRSSRAGGSEGCKDVVEGNGCQILRGQGRSTRSPSHYWSSLSHVDIIFFSLNASEDAPVLRSTLMLGLVLAATELLPTGCWIFCSWIDDTSFIRITIESCALYCWYLIFLLSVHHGSYLEDRCVG